MDLGDDDMYIADDGCYSTNRSPEWLKSLCAPSRGTTLREKLTFNGGVSDWAFHCIQQEVLRLADLGMLGYSACRLWEVSFF